MSAEPKRTIQILVVDDEPMVCTTMHLLLKREGHQVQCAESGVAALSLLEAGRFDLIITDYSMGEMNGDQLAAKIKKTHPSLPIIMMTAFAADFNLRGRPNGGVDRVLEKPFSAAVLTEAIAGVLARTQPH